MSRIDWGGLMRVGLHGLRLKPQYFCRLTPAELDVMAGLSGAPRPLDRARLVALRDAFPDERETWDATR